jgi:nucleoside-diphosphate-sugar epimerase
VADEPAPTIGGTVAVTGASGFIGSHLVPALLGADVRVRAITRREGRWAAGTGEVALVALDDRVGVRRALMGVGTLVHLAGRAHQGGELAADAAAFRAVNVDALGIVLHEAAAAGVERVVFLSSIGAVASTSDLAVSDATAPAPDTVYGRSKLEAEALVREHSARTGMEHVILRPPMVIGPRMRGNPLRLFHAVNRGLPLPLGLVRNARSLIYVENLVHAIRHALALPRGTGDTFAVADGPPLSSATLVREVARALGRSPRLLPVPVAALRLAGRLGDLAGRVMPFALSSDMVLRLVGSLVVDDARFRRASGYAPRHGLDEALQVTAQWFRAPGRCR